MLMQKIAMVIPALLKASYKGRLEIVKYLVVKGANVNAKDHYDSTALMMASRRNNLEIVKYLVRNGANVNAKNNYGETALIGASR